MKRLMFGVTAALLMCSGAMAQEPVNFAGKTITMIIGYAPGGGTDTSGRLIAQFLAKYLPGSPNVIVEKPWRRARRVTPSSTSSRR
jgi:tripartite-type tricarboxylate transporter receptor subunit TctC